MMTTTTLASAKPKNHIVVNMTESEKGRAQAASLPVCSISNTAHSIGSMCKGAGNWMWNNKGKIYLGALFMTGSYATYLLGAEQANAALTERADDFERSMKLKMDNIEQKLDGIAYGVKSLDHKFNLDFSRMSEAKKQEIFATTTMQTPRQSTDVNGSTEKAKEVKPKAKARAEAKVRAAAKAAAKAETEAKAAAKAETEQKTETKAETSAHHGKKCKHQFYMLNCDGDNSNDFESFGVGYASADGKVQSVVQYKMTPGEQVSCHVEVNHHHGVPHNKLPYAISQKDGVLIYSAYDEPMGENNIAKVLAYGNDVKVTELRYVEADCPTIRPAMSPPCDESKLVWGDAAEG